MSGDNDGWTRYTGETCDECGAKMLKHIPGDVRECTNGHRPEANICDDCGEEIMDTHLGELCGCEN